MTSRDKPLVSKDSLRPGLVASARDGHAGRVKENQRPLGPAPSVSRSSPKELPRRSLGMEKDQVTCFICAESPVPFWSIGKCLHPYCWKCSLRLRVLFDSKICPMCKEANEQVYFTSHADSQFDAALLLAAASTTTGTASVDSALAVYFDKKLKIYFENEAVRLKCMDLLSLACSVKDCRARFTSRQDFLPHIRKAHGLEICELCFQHQKWFFSEIQLFESAQHLKMHIRQGDGHSFKGHPQCGFCRVNYYSEDELYEHCRDRHEVCHLCQAAGKHHQYFASYDVLEDHFARDHFACREPDCLEKKFVVFLTDIDLKAHMAHLHKGRGQRSAQRKAMSIQIDLQTGTLREQPPPASPCSLSLHAPSHQRYAPQPSQSIGASDMALTPHDTNALFPSLLSPNKTSPFDSLFDDLAQALPRTTDHSVAETRHRLYQTLSSTASHRAALEGAIHSIALFVRSQVAAKELGASLVQTLGVPSTLKVMRTLVDCFPSTDPRSVDSLKVHQELRAPMQTFPSLPSSSRTSQIYQDRPSLVTAREPRLTAGSQTLSDGHRPLFTQMVKNPNAASSSLQRLLPMSYSSMMGRYGARLGDADDFPSLAPAVPKAASPSWAADASAPEQTRPEPAALGDSALPPSKKKGSKKKTVIMRFG